MSLSIRPLVESDLEVADALLCSAFRQTESRRPDLELYREVEPNGLWLAVRDGQPVGMVGAVNYGAFAYIGFMVVHEAVQRQGIGLAVMQHLLGMLERQGVPVALLDASAAGFPMYCKLGFVDYDASQMFRVERAPGVECPPQVRPVSMGAVAGLAAWDQERFGADRGRALEALLAAFPGRTFMLREGKGPILGYICAQSTRIGPWVANRPADADVLLQAALSVPFAGPVSVAVPGLNPEAGQLLRRYGFDLARTNRHMGRGASEPPSRRRQIYGQACLFFG